jgi:hypothetical protein
MNEKRRPITYTPRVLEKYPRCANILFIYTAKRLDSTTETEQNDRYTTMLWMQSNLLYITEIVADVSIEEILFLFNTNPNRV